MPLPLEIDFAHGLAVMGGEPHIFHCHHYNCFLQKTVMDLPALVPHTGADLDIASLLTRPAVEVAFPQFQQLKWDRATLEEAFRTLGFGRVELSGLTAQGGQVALNASHYGLGWLSRFGKGTQAVCFMAAGFVEAAARHLFGGDFHVYEDRCIAKGDRSCQLIVERGGVPLTKSPGLGTLATFGTRPPKAAQTSVDEAAIVQACGGLPLAGDAEGKIQAFGVALTRHYANYYNLLSYRFEQAMANQGEGGAMMARMLLNETGLVCAFHTFGGIMESAEWEGLIKPQCKTLEDWAYGMVAVVNALGWGRWSVADIVPEKRLEIVVDGSYESNGYLAAFGKSSEPRCYLANGGTAGLMNLLYRARIAERPDLTTAFYERVFKRSDHFISREVECRSMGAKACRFIAEPA